VELQEKIGFASGCGPTVLYNITGALTRLSNATSLAHENAVVKVRTRQDSRPQRKYMVEEGNRTV
jgi:hypothetical protein